MPLFLSGSDELDSNIETMINELKEYLTLILGEDISKVKVVGFALYYTMQTLPEDPKRDEKIHTAFEVIKKKIRLEDKDFIDKLIHSFKDKSEQHIKELLKKTIEGGENDNHQSQ